MAELFRNAWQGWQAVMNAGKLPAALLIALLFLWIYYRRMKRKEFLIYTTVVTVFCILPVTAAALMLYQTRFYDYKWIWSMVPMTAAVGAAISLFMTEFLQKGTGRDRKRRLAAGVLLAAVLMFCGGMGAGGRDVSSYEERRQAEAVLADLQERMQDRKSACGLPGDCHLCQGI